MEIKKSNHMKATCLFVLSTFFLFHFSDAQTIVNPAKKSPASKPKTGISQLGKNNVPVLEIDAGEAKLRPGKGVMFSGNKPVYTINIEDITLTAGEGLEIVGEYPNYRVEFKKHFVGEEYLGGIVFYVDETGHHGLVAGEFVTGSWTTYEWEYYKNTEKIVGYTVDEDEARITPKNFKTLNNWLDGVGAGKYNTMNMIANDDKYLNVVEIGEPYSITFSMADKFPNWYIPSHAELKILYKQRHLLPASARIGVYWSSTEGGLVERYKRNGPRGENLDKKYLAGYSKVKVDLGKWGVTGVKCIDFANGLTIDVAKTYDHQTILIREF